MLVIVLGPPPLIKWLKGIVHIPYFERYLLSTSLRKKLVLRRAIPPFRAQLFLKVVISSSIVVIWINASCLRKTISPAARDQCHLERTSQP